MKSFLFVMRHSAYDGVFIRETLDTVLIAAAFDQRVSILLLDDAVFHLKKCQLGAKPIADIYRSLTLYDVNDIYIESESLQESGLKLDDLVMPVMCVPRNTMGTFMQSFDLVLGE